MKVRRRRHRVLESLECRQLLAVDLQIVVDPYELEMPGDEVSRTVRVFNNGDQEAVDAVVQSSLTSQLDDPTWVRNSGFARFVQKSGPVGPRVPAVVPIDPRRVPINDFNGDGVQDLWISGLDGGYIQLVGKGRIDIVLTSPSSYPQLNPLRDVNADGFADVSIEDFVVFGRAMETGAIVLEELDGGNGFQLEQAVQLEAAGDLNADGFDDIVVAFQEGEDLVFWGATNVGNQGTYRFGDLVEKSSLAMRLPFDVIGQTLVGDVNGDGYVDVGFDLARGGGLGVVLTGPDVATIGDAAWVTIARLVPGGSRTYAGYRSGRNVGDVSGDGIDDLVVNFDGGECFDCSANDKGYMEINGGAILVLGRHDLGDLDVVDSNVQDVYTFYVQSDFGPDRPDTRSEDRNGDGILDIVLTADMREFVVFGGNELRSYDFGRERFLGFNGEDGYSSTVERVIEFPTHSSRIAQGDADIAEEVRIPPGESLIYTITGRLKPDAATGLASSVAAARGDLENDLTDNLVTNQDAVFLDVEARGSFTPGASTTIEIVIANFGPNDADSVTIEETVSASLRDATWSVVNQVFPNEIVLAEWNRHLVSHLDTSDYFCDGNGMSGTLGDINGDGFDESYTQSYYDTLVFEGGPAVGDSRGRISPLAMFRGVSGANGLGDINGDGFDDFFAHVRYDSLVSQGSYIVLGQREFPTTTSGRLRFVDLDAAGAIKLVSSDGEMQPSELRTAGDVNGDGFDDMLAGPHVLFGSPERSFSESWYFSVLDETNSLVVTSAGNRVSLSPVGDINGDGIDDIAVSSTRPNNSSSGYILFGSDQFQLGSLDAESASQIQLRTAGNSWSQIRFAPEGVGHDFNGDGVDDVVFTDDNHSDRKGAVFVLFGQAELAAGTRDLHDFDGEQGLAILGAADRYLGQRFTVGDLNGDQRDDLIFSNGTSEAIVYNIASGGNLTSPMTLDALLADDIAQTTRIVGLGYSSRPLSFASGFDANQDGIDDLLLTEPYVKAFDPFCLGRGEVTLLLGRQSVTIDAESQLPEFVDLPVDSSITYRVSGIVPEETDFRFGSVTVTPNLDQFQLNPTTVSKLVRLQPELPMDTIPLELHQRLDAGSELPSVDADFADLDGDGDQDIFVTIGSGPNQVWMNDGTGTFSLRATLGEGHHTSTALGDIDNDGDVDAVVAAGENESNRVWLNNGFGDFTNSGFDVGNPEATSVDVALADFDRDGDLDLYVANANNVVDWLFLNDGSGRFVQTVQGWPKSSYNRVEVADIDNDGQIDIVAASSRSPSRVWLKSRGEIFTAGAYFPIAASQIAPVDLDADGDEDLVSVEATGIQVWWNDGSGGFVLGDRLPASLGSAIAVADLDRDGDTEIVVAASEGASTIWSSQLGQYRKISALVETSTARTSRIALGDIDQDGDMDLLFANSGLPSAIYRNDSSTILLSDLDRDLIVAFSDFLILSNNFGRTNATRFEGDLDGSGKVDFLDYIILAADFGKFRTVSAD